MEKFEIIGRKLIRYRGSEDEVTIPDGVEVIAEGAFRDCRDMCSVTLPEGLKRIENEAFQWCARLESVHAPESIEYIGQDVFAGTPFYKYYNENEVQWKDDFLFLGKCLFKARRNIREADIPEGTVSITADAFNERVLREHSAECARYRLEGVFRLLGTDADTHSVRRAPYRLALLQGLRTACRRGV